MIMEYVREVKLLLSSNNRKWMKRTKRSKNWYKRLEWKILNSPSTRHIPNIQVCIEQFHLKKTWKLAKQLMHNKSYNVNIKVVGEEEM